MQSCMLVLMNSNTQLNEGDDVKVTHLVTFVDDATYISETETHYILKVKGREVQLRKKDVLTLAARYGERINVDGPK